MSIRHFFGKTVVVRRLKSSGGYKTHYMATATVEGAIQEMDLRAKREIGIIEGRAWEAWFELDDDIKEQDTITDDDGVVYKVIEVTKKDYGINQHLDIIMVEYIA